MSKLVRGGQLAAVPRQDCLDARLAQAPPPVSVRLHTCCIELTSKLVGGGQLAAVSRQDCPAARLRRAPLSACACICVALREPPSSVGAAGSSAPTELPGRAADQSAPPPCQRAPARVSP